VYRTCTDYFRDGYRENGIYEIKPSDISDKRFNVYCNMSAGGWTSIFKRSLNSKTEFQLGIEAYKQGFGDLNNDHFLGN
jgi:ficolin